MELLSIHEAKYHKVGFILFWSCFLSSLTTFALFPTDIDMKKDIETLIAEERADIILKYATVSLCLKAYYQFFISPQKI